jgi:hypothetical protein
MSTLITVTAEHIAHGVRESCTDCPVALAIMDALPCTDLIAVDGDEVTFGEIADWTEVKFPAEVQLFIKAFDDGEPVEPFSFTLDYPAVTS